MRAVTLIGTIVSAALLASCYKEAPEKASLSSSVITAAEAPAGMTQPLAKQTIVLVHGAWAGGWEWKKCGDLLATHGHTVYRPTFTGQGERVHLASPDIDVNTHINDIVNTILFENLRDFVLVGHSYGGMVITGVIDRVPERIKAVIYVDAILPENGESANMILNRERKIVDGFVPLDPAPNPNRRPPYIVAMPAKCFSTPVTLKNQEAVKKIPTAYILTVDKGKKPEEDIFFKSYQRAEARGWATSIMEGTHVVHIDQTANLVERLEKGVTDARPAK